MLFRNWYYLSVNMTESEKALEPAIAALGERYRSQWLFPRLWHIADFVLLDRKLIVEVDGDSHLNPEQQRKDIEHTLALEELGFAVVRVSNRDAREDPKGVAESLYFLSASRPSRAELLEALAALPPAAPKRSRRGKKTPTKPPKPSPEPRAGTRPGS